MATTIIQWVRFIAVMIAAGIIGNWFMVENRKNKAKNGPWYGAYLSIPGVIIIAAIILLPVLIVFLKQ